LLLQWCAAMNAKHCTRDRLISRGRQAANRKFFAWREIVSAGPQSARAFPTEKRK
jgi:hypothetical protein